MTEATEVLVIGGGPVGLALAVDLGLRGVRAVLVERDARHSPQPRAKTTNVRSMEHMRRWGVADRLRAAAPLPAAYGSEVVFATRLSGHLLARFGNALFADRRRRDERFAEPAQWIPQYKVEAALRARAAELPSVTLRFGARLDALAQDADGVTATIADAATGAASTLRAAYAVGADGARSRVREIIGARMRGDHAYAQHVNLVVRAPALAEAARGLPPAIMYWLVNPDAPGVTGPMDRDSTWFFMFGLAPGEAVPDEPALRARMDAAFGRPVPCDILVVDPWSAHSLIADRYREGRVVLAGDACHLHPPFGGYGMNLGLGDAVDLGWKLAALLRGWGGPRLLDSYEAERRPVHRRVIEEAVANHALLPRDLARPGLEEDGPAGEAARAEVGAIIASGKEREFRSLGVVLGGYAESPIVVPDGTAPPEEHPIRHVPSARPGARAPHLWLRDGRSLFDLWGPGFTALAAAPDAEGDAAPFAAAARRAGVPLAVAAPGDDRLGALYGARLALVRPDGHVAWRGDRVGEDEAAAAILDRARGA